jgi:hypothetical protein
MGIGSFLLPIVGLQFRLLAVFGDSQWKAGTLIGVVGALMVAWSYLFDD